MKFRIDWPNRGHGYTEKEINVVVDVMRNVGEPLTQGTNVQLFEQSFAKYLNVDKTFSTMSCAHALDIAAMLADIQPGDEVIIPAHTYCASAISFARRGAIIKWADIDPDSLSMSLDSLKKLISNKTKAVVLVHLYGLLSPHVLEIADLTTQKNIMLIEDCAQSLGSSVDGKQCGTFGDIGCYSFHSQKNLTTLGEGGLLVVKSPDLAAKVPGLRLNGHTSFTDKEEYWLPAMSNVDQDIEGVWPMKSSMSETQAAVGRLVLERLDDLTEQRRIRGLAFRKALADYPEVHFQSVGQDKMHSHHLLPIRYDGKKFNRDDLIRILSSEYGIKAIIQYYPLNRYGLFSKSGHGNANIPNTDYFFDNMVSFPFSLEINDDDFNYLIDSVRTTIHRLRG